MSNPLRPRFERLRLQLDRLQIRKFRLVLFDDLDSTPAKILPSTRYFALLLAVDATAYSEARLRKWSKAMLNKGAVYLCAWGKDCERVHDCFDHQRSGDETHANVKVTTWHAEETIEDMAFFFVWCAIPADDFQNDCEWIALSPKGAEWNGSLEKRLRTLCRKAGDSEFSVQH